MDQSCLYLQRLIACFANILFSPFLSMHCAFVPNDRGGSHLFLADFTLKTCANWRRVTGPVVLSVILVVSVPDLL